MHTVATAASRQPFQGFGIVETLASFKDRMDKSRAYNRTVCELSALGANELKDLGIARHEIADTAHDCVYGTRKVA
ncbi:DUF1127 domain-containing protein [Rhodobacteraceae bacterium KMM 6894]|nr:DUF1127 domain-containing protein [Rhodobacteraceae bacterium KMM 6894]